MIPHKKQVFQTKIIWLQSTDKLTTHPAMKRRELDIASDEFRTISQSPEMEGASMMSGPWFLVSLRVVRCKELGSEKRCTDAVRNGIRTLRPAHPYYAHAQD